MADNNQCKSCSMQQQDGGCSSETCAPNEKALFGTMNEIRKVIAVMSGKGGVGKSTVTSLLAVHLARQGYSVGVLDADITGPSIPKAFGIPGGNLKATDFGIIPPRSSRQGIKIMSVNLFLPNEDDPVIWRGPMLGGLLNQFWGETDWREIDYMILDLPPGTGDVPLNIMQTLPVDGIIIVSSPQELVQMIVNKAVKMARKMNTPILGMVENMSHARCPHCQETIPLFGASEAENAAKKLNIPLLGQLSWDVNINKLMDAGTIEDSESIEAAELAKAVVTALPVA